MAGFIRLTLYPGRRALGFPPFPEARRSLPPNTLAREARTSAKLPLDRKRGTVQRPGEG